MVNYDPHNEQSLTTAEIALLELAAAGHRRRRSERARHPGRGRLAGGRLHEDLEAGRWFDFKAQQERLRRRLLHHALPRLHARLGGRLGEELARPASSAGPCGGADEDDGAGEDSADTIQRRAYIESTYAARLPIAGTPALPTWSAVGSIRHSSVPTSSSEWAGASGIASTPSR